MPNGERASGLGLLNTLMEKASMMRITDTHSRGLSSLTKGNNYEKQDLDSRYDIVLYFS